MPWDVYSERFLAQAAAGTWTYEVPEGHRAIVTAVDAANLGADAAQAQVKIGLYTLFYVPDLGTYKAVTWRGRQVVYQGELIVLYIDAGVHSLVSGYLLLDGSGRTGPPLSSASKPVLPDRPEVEPR